MSEAGFNELSRGEEPHLAYIPLQWTTGDEPDQDSHVHACVNIFGTVRGETEETAKP